jgi:hypothetical protein
LRIARWFSPVEDFRPILNPKLSASFTAQFVSQRDGFREPLISAGRPVHGYFLYVEHQTGQLHLISQSDNSTVVYSMVEPGERRVNITVEYSPDSRAITVKIDGTAVIVHPVETLVTAPADVAIAEDEMQPDVTGTHFTGRLRGVKKIVEPGSR